MSRRVQYTPDKRGMAELMVSSDIAKVVQSAADRGVSWLVASAPSTADYSASFRTEAFDYEIFGQRRASVAIVNDSPAAVNIDRKYGLFPRVVDVIEADSR